MKLTNSIRTLLIAAAVAVPMLTLPAAQAHAGIILSVNIAPPVLPVYTQPVCPGDGYIWTPGYWAYGDDGYFWVPGTWVLAPESGYLWTPAWWGWEGGVYVFHPGYWGPHIGFYGGINYGFGYFGVGFEGGYWDHGHFYYNRAVGNFYGAHVAYGYSHPVAFTNHSTVAFNGGQGGIQVRASAQEMAAMHEPHLQPTSEQMQHQSFAASNRSQYASVNHGHPGTAAAATPGAFRSNPNGRAANQDQRIANGLRSGQMTSGEAARADRTQSNIDSQIHNDRMANGGTLTNQERQQINQEQNAASRQIYNENHNGNTVAPNAVDNREANQQQRTAQGLRTGQETAGEAARTNANQSRVDQQVHNDRVNNGGALNKQQRQQVNKEQNRNSKQIYNQKHNNNTAPRGRGRR